MNSEIQTSLRTRTEHFFRALQDEITSTLEILDGTEKFFQETWERPGGGGGRTRILTEGTIFEKSRCKLFFGVRRGAGFHGGGKLDFLCNWNFPRAASALAENSDGACELSLF